ncbi:peptidoglycan-binding protein [Citrobacter braakii]|uniref:peptidoglycan-binding protein n=1 Tax=Citrobacter braakii TaxID=57706 RepID=UPI004039E0FC
MNPNLINADGFSASAFQTRINAVWFDGKITDAQRECLAAFAAVWLLYNRIPGRNVPVSWLAYILATTYHETAATMQPIAEYGRGKGRPYGKPDPETGQTYYGRGYVQLTWKDNYQLAQDVVIDINTMAHDVPLVMQPDLALKAVYAAQIAINGMSSGWFTGKKLGDYLTANKTDYVNARRIINGTDKAETIAAYALEAEAAIRLALGEEITRSLVKDGSRGDDVRELQLMLNISADGIAGNNTAKAIRAFQSAHGLDDDGKCGKNTWAALDAEVYGL